MNRISERTTDPRGYLRDFHSPGGQPKAYASGNRLPAGVCLTLRPTPLKLHAIAGPALLIAVLPLLLSGGAVSPPTPSADEGLPATSGVQGSWTSSSGGLNQSWLRPGFTVEYRGHPLNEGASGTPLDWVEGRYRVAERDPVTDRVRLELEGFTLESVSFRSIVFDVSTREEVPRNGRYTPLWINASNVATGEAWIGDEHAVMTPMSNAAFYQFATSTRTFHYDRATGLLLGVVGGDTARFAFQSGQSG